MSERMDTLNIELNRDYQIRLLFDQPKTGESQYGPWHLYGVEYDNETLGLFADLTLHGMLKDYRKGDCLVVRRKKSDDDINWQVKRLINGKGSDPTPGLDDRTRDIHRQVALKIATQSMGSTTKLWTDYEKAEIQSRVNALLEILDGNPDNDLPF